MPIYLRNQKANYVVCVSIYDKKMEKIKELKQLQIEEG
jgi:hypothetical protein